RIEAGRIEDRILGAEEAGEALFEIFVNRMRSADETDRGHAVTVAIQREPRGFAHGCMVCKPEIVVRAQINRFLAVRHANDCMLGRSEDAFGLVQSLLVELLELMSESREEFAFHDGFP